MRNRTPSSILALVFACTAVLCVDQHAAAGETRYGDGFGEPPLPALADLAQGPQDHPPEEVGRAPQELSSADLARAPQDLAPMDLDRAPQDLAPVDLAHEPQDPAVDMSRPPQDLAPVDPDGLALAAGEFAWLPGADENRDAPVTLHVSLRDQRGYLYREGRRIAVTTVSTGRPGHDTPVGVFPITEKRKTHYSNRYDNAPMPWMQRLTNWGHALHAGDVRPTPASHGCVRLPPEFAEQLFSMTRTGNLVVISEDRSPRSLAIAFAVAGADHDTALQVGVTAPLPRIILIPREPRVASEETAKVGAEGVTAL